MWHSVTALLILASSSALSSFCVGVEFSSLDSALQASVHTSTATIELAEALASFQYFSSIRVENTLQIYGKGQTITFHTPMTVISQLTLSNVTLESGLESFSYLFLVSGNLLLDGVFFRSTFRALASVMEGKLQLYNSQLLALQGISYIFVSGRNFTAIIEDVEVYDSFKFLDSITDHGEGNTSITLNRVTMSNCTNALFSYLVQHSSPLSSFTFKFERCNFQSNRNNIWYFSASEFLSEGVKIEATNCNFSNSSGVFILNFQSSKQIAKNAFALHVSDCSFTNIFYEAVKIILLEDTLPSNNYFSVQVFNSSFTKIQFVFFYHLYNNSQPSTNFLDLEIDESRFDSNRFVMYWNMINMQEPTYNRVIATITRSIFISNDVLAYGHVDEITQPLENQYTIKIINSDVSYSNYYLFYGTYNNFNQSLQLASIEISGCSFSFNKEQILRISMLGTSSTAFVRIDNSTFHSHDSNLFLLTWTDKASHNSVEVKDCRFLNNSKAILAINQESSAEPASSFLSLQFTNCYVYKNEEFFLAFVEAKESGHLRSLQVTGCTFEESNVMACMEIRAIESSTDNFIPIQVTNCTFVKNRGAVLSLRMSWQYDKTTNNFIAVRVFNCVFNSSAGLVLNVSPAEDFEYNFTIELFKCSFIATQSAIFDFTIGVEVSLQTLIKISECTIESNLNSLFFIGLSRKGQDDIPFLQVSQSRFVSNQLTLFIVTRSYLLITFDSCTWDKESLNAFYASNQNGRIRVRNSEFVNIEMGGLANLVGDTRCAFELDTVTIRDTGFADAATALLFLFNCEFTARNILVRNFYFSNNSTKTALFQFLQSSADFDGLSVVESGCSGSIIFGFRTAFTIKNSRFISIYSGNMNVISIGLADFTLANVNFSDIAKGPEMKSESSYNRPVFIAWSKGHADIQDILIDKQTYITTSDNSKYGYSAILMVLEGSYTINKVRLNDLLIDYFAVLYSSSGSMTVIDFKNVTFQLFAFNLFRGSSILIENIMLTQVTAHRDEGKEIVGHLKGLGLVGSNCELDITTMHIADSDFTTLFVLKQSSIRIQTMVMTNSRTVTLISECVESSVTITDAIFEDAHIGQILLVECILQISQSIYRRIEVLDRLFYATTSTITLLNVTVEGFSSMGTLGVVHQNSTMAILSNSWESISAQDGIGFEVDSAKLHVTGSRFSNFNVNFFQLADTQYYISDLVVQNGYTAIKSNYAYGAFLSCLNCKRGEIARLSVFNLTAINGGALAFRATPDTSQFVLISESRFTSCSAERGGAIYISNTSFSILNSSFEFNNAGNFGGAIDASISSAMPALLHHCLFKANKALEGGGVKWHESSIAIANCSFQGNEAEYGPDLASYPAALASRLTATSLPGSGHPTSFEFFLIDHYGQKVTTANNIALQLHSSRYIDYRGGNSSLSHQGVFTFSDIIVYAKPATIQTCSGSIDDFFQSKKIAINGTIDIHFRNCSRGEIYRPNQCEFCNSGNVSYSADDVSCIHCPLNAFCYGGSNMTVNPRYWRKAWNSTVVLECPLPDKCLGGPNSTCADRFTGKLCIECANNTYRSRVTECENCGDFRLLWLQLSLIWIVLMAFTWAVIKYGVQDPDEFRMFVLKCIVNHAQLLSAMSPYRVSYPSVAKYFLQAVSYLSSLNLSNLPISCFGYSLPEYIRASIGSLIYPLVAVGSLPALLFIVGSFRRTITVLLTSIALFIPAITVQSVVLLLSCISFETSEQWMFVDMSQKCWTGLHQVMVINVLIPSVLINCVFPLMAAVVIKLISPDAFKANFPMWSAGCILPLWDIFNTVAKCFCLWLMLNSISYNPLSQVAYGLISLLALCILNVSLHSFVYKHPMCLLMCEVSAVLVGVSLGLGSYYVYNVPSGSIQDFIVVALLLLLNGGYFGACFALLQWAAHAEKIPIYSRESKINSEFHPGPPPNSLMSFSSFASGSPSL